MTNEAFTSAVEAELARHEAALDALALSAAPYEGISIPFTPELREQLDAIERVAPAATVPLPTYAIPA